MIRYRSQILGAAAAAALLAGYSYAGNIDTYLFKDTFDLTHTDGQVLHQSTPEVGQRWQEIGGPAGAGPASTSSDYSNPAGGLSAKLVRDTSNPDNPAYYPDPVLARLDWQDPANLTVADRTYTLKFDFYEPTTGDMPNIYYLPGNIYDTGWFCPDGEWAYLDYAAGKWVRSGIMNGTGSWNNIEIEIHNGPLQGDSKYTMTWDFYLTRGEGGSQPAMTRTKIMSGTSAVARPEGQEPMTYWQGYGYCYFDNVELGYSVVAGPSVWITNGDGDWSVASNWQGGVPNAVDAAAELTNAITAAHTITLDVPVTVGSIKFENANAYTIAGTNALTIDVSTGAGSLNLVNGSHAIAAPLVLAKSTAVAVPAGQTLTVSGDQTASAGVTLSKEGVGTLAMKDVRADSLVINAGTVQVLAGGSANLAAGASVVKSLAIAGGPTGPTGRLDLTNNSMVIDYTGSVGTLVDETRLYIANGGIRSSSADATKNLGYADNAALGLSSFAGQTVDADSLLIKYTYLGDTNLDGQVDVIDLGNLATGWQTSGVWANGDSNYDGTIDVIDLGLLATNWQAGVGSPLGPGSLDQALAAFGLPGVAVPEPGMMGLALMAGAALKRRIRR